MSEYDKKLKDIFTMKGKPEKLAKMEHQVLKEYCETHPFPSSDEMIDDIVKCIEKKDDFSNVVLLWTEHFCDYSYKMMKILYESGFDKEKTKLCGKLIGDYGVGVCKNEYKCKETECYTGFHYLQSAYYIILNFVFKNELYLNQVAGNILKNCFDGIHHWQV